MCVCTDEGIEGVGKNMYVVERMRPSSRVESEREPQFPLYIYASIYSLFYLTRLNNIIFIIDMYARIYEYMFVYVCVCVCYITKFIFIPIEI